MTFLETNETFRAVDDLIESIGGLTDSGEIIAAATRTLTAHHICDELRVASLPDDATTPEASTAASRPEEDAGSVVVPLHATGVAIGTVTFVSSNPRRFGDHEIEAFERVGDILGMALEKSRLITELRQQIEVVDHNNERLEASNQDLEDFAYVASHDLQEPLRKIRAFSDRLATKAADRLTEREREYLTRMQAAALRMNTLISDLLDFSRVNTRGDDVAPVDTNHIVALAIDACRAAIELNDGTVEVGVLPTVTADSAQLLQVFVALIDNAIKFRHPEVAPHVQINVVDDGDTAYNTLVVADNGLGFDAKYLDRIFKPFQRLNSRERYPGSGIGLAVCRRVAERHNGSIDATSIVGSGSRFVFRIPRSTVAADEGGLR